MPTKKKTPAPDQMAEAIRYAADTFAAALDRFTGSLSVAMDRASSHARFYSEAQLRAFQHALLQFNASCRASEVEAPADTYSIKLIGPGVGTDGFARKIELIKYLRELLYIGLKEAKDMSEQGPVVIKAGIDAIEAACISARLKEINATFTITNSAGKEVS